MGVRCVSDNIIDHSTQCLSVRQSNYMYVLNRGQYEYFRCNATTLLCFNIAGSNIMLLYDCWQQCYGSNRIAPSNVVDAITLLHLL